MENSARIGWGIDKRLTSTDIDTTTGNERKIVAREEERQIGW